MVSVLDKLRRRSDDSGNKDKQVKSSFQDYPHLMRLRPKNRVQQHSDYMVVGGRYVTILNYFHDDSATEDLPPFWGLSRIPMGMPDGVSTVLLESIGRRDKSWVDDRIKRSEQLDDLSVAQSGEVGERERQKTRKRSVDLANTIADINDNAAYLHVHYRLMVSAPSLEVLDDAVGKIKQQYTRSFTSLTVDAYPGEQFKELRSLFDDVHKRRGKGFYFTSPEMAGSHMLVTNGLNDPGGQYVGEMSGDMNNPAVNFDVNKYRQRVVVASEDTDPRFAHARMADLWGSKISQAALESNGKVVHLVLNGADLNKLGPSFSRLTQRVDMSAGDVNMFELFGSPDKQLTIFPAHVEKIVLMTMQSYKGSKGMDVDMIAGALRKILNDFYHDKRMWVRSAKAEDKSRLRLVGLPHEEYPRMQDFQSYLEQEHRRLLARGSLSSQKTTEAFELLSMIYRNLLDTNGDLFNTYTSSRLDGVNAGRRIIYDFGDTMRRGKHIAMAQLVNIIGFAVETIGRGDVVIIHGAELIDPAVQKFLSDQFSHMMERGGRVAYLYGSVDSMLDDLDFCKLDMADYSILGPIRDTEKYARAIHQQLPASLEALISRRGQLSCFIHRGVDNVVFAPDLLLGIEHSDVSDNETIVTDTEAETPIETEDDEDKTVEVDESPTARGMTRHTPIRHVPGPGSREQKD